MDNANEDEAQQLMNAEGEENNDVDNSESKEPERYCCCCSDTVCIGIAWGIFVICVIIFIIAICFKLQKD